jgi:sodium-dependent phosphate transporter
VVGIAFGVGVGVAILGIPLYIQCKKRILDGKFVPPATAIEVADAEAASGVKKEATKTEEAPTPFGGTFKKAVATSLNNDPHASVGVDTTTTAIHRNAEKFDRNAEAFFTYLQIFSAIFDSVAHGANDVANAVGPFATIFVVYTTGVVDSKADMGDNRYWILGLGGIGIGVGLLLYGYKIMRAIGVKLAVVTPVRGFCIEMGSSIIVIIGSYLGLPLSTTHCQVGATAGVALLEGAKGCSPVVLIKTGVGAGVTCFCVGILSALLFSLGAYAPMANPPPPTELQCDALFPHDH